MKYSVILYIRKSNDGAKRCPIGMSENIQNHPGILNVQSGQSKNDTDRDLGCLLHIGLVQHEDR